MIPDLHKSTETDFPGTGGWLGDNHRIQNLPHPLNGCFDPAKPGGGVVVSSAASAYEATLLFE
jgi:hypothetical protein